MRINDLRTKRAGILASARALIDTDAPSTDDVARYDAMIAEADAMQGQITRLERQIQIDAELAAHRGAVADAGGGSVDEQADAVKREKRLFVAWATGRFGALSEADQRTIAQRTQNDPRFTNAASVGTAGAGGYTVAPDFMRELLIAQKAFGGVRQVARQITTDTGVDLPWPKMDDTANVASIVGENTAGAAGTDMAFTSATLKAWTWRSGFLVLSIELMQDSAFDFDALIRDALAVRFARGQNTAYTLGAGTAGPEGLLVGATLGKTGVTGQTTSVIYDDLIDLQHSVDPAYRQGAVWMMHDSTVKVIRKLKDSQGRPLWTDGSIQAGIPNKLLDAEVVVNQDMPVMAANAKSIAYGNFGNYIIRDVMGLRITRLNERFAENGQVGFIAFQRNDGRTVSAAQPVRYYANSAT